MKRSIIRTVALLLCICAILPVTLASCKGYGETVMSLGDIEITDSEIKFWLGRYKAQFYYSYGESLKKEYDLSSLDDIWRLTDPDSGKTYDEIFTAYVHENAETYLAALALFEENGLSLSKSNSEEIDKIMADYIKSFTTKEDFNYELAQYGVNYDILCEIYRMMFKIEQLHEYLASSGIAKVTDDYVEKFYQQNYFCMKQAVIYINECPEVDENGKYKTDADGKTLYRDMTEEETKKARERADKAMSLLGTTSFEQILADYDENRADDIYTDGFYISADSIGGDKALTKIYEQLAKMKPGETALVEADNTIHIIKKLELKPGAYNETVNQDFFLFYDSAQGTYVKLKAYLSDYVVLDYINQYLEEHRDAIVRDTEKLNGLTISSVEPNYYY